MENKLKTNIFCEIYFRENNLNRNYPITREEFIKYSLSEKVFDKYLELIVELQDIVENENISIDEKNSENIDTILSEKSECIKKIVTLLINNNILDASYSEKKIDISMELAIFVFLNRVFFPSEDDFRLFFEHVLTLDYFQYYFGKTFKLHRGFSVMAEGEKPTRTYAKYDEVNKTIVDLDAHEVEKIILQIRKELDKYKKQTVILEKKLVTFKIDDENADSIMREMAFNKYFSDGLVEYLEDIQQYKEKLAVPIKEIKKLHVFFDDDKCSKNGHSLHTIKVEDDFYDFSKHKKVKRCFTIRRCAHCMQYQIQFDDYIEILHQYGALNCEVVFIGENGKINTSGFNDASVFKANGYSVSQTDGLSRELRQAVLKRMIENKKVTKYETIQFLRNRIAINGSKAENFIAVKKWREDLEFVKNL